MLCCLHQQSTRLCAPLIEFFHRTLKKRKNAANLIVAAPLPFDVCIITPRFLFVNAFYEKILNDLQDLLFILHFAAVFIPFFVNYAQIELFLKRFLQIFIGQKSNIIQAIPHKNIERIHKGEGFVRKTEFDQVLFGRSFLVQEISPDLPAEESWRRISEMQKRWSGLFSESPPKGGTLCMDYTRDNR